MILDDFFTRALLAGIGMAIVAGPLGCFVIWRRLAYFGDTLAHSGLLGVTIGFILNIDLSLSVFVISGIIALLLIVLQKKTKLAGDALLGLLAHSSLAIGLVFIAILTTIRFDLMGLLLGDILSVTTNDIIPLIRKLNPNKATGSDGISAQMLLLCGKTVTLPLKILYSNILSTGIYPNIWKLANVTPIHKKMISR